MNPSEPVIVRVTHRFEASAERVFDAWLDPAKARQFLFATPEGTMTQAEIDARVGGGFVIVERRASEDAKHFGVYLEIDRPRRLVFAFSTDKADPDGSRVTVDIVHAGTGCELTLTQHMAPEWAQSGWTSILDGLARLLSGADSEGASK